MLCLISALLLNQVLSYHWQKLPSSGIRTHEHAVVYDPAGDLFFIIGGDSTNNHDFMDICLSFDPKTNIWEAKQPMPTKRRTHNASYRKGFIHVLCGEDELFNEISKHAIYNIASDSWDTAAPAPVKVSRPGAVTWRDSLVYLIGGYSVPFINGRKTVYYYDATTNTWDTATSLPVGFADGAIKIKGDSIFIIGGRGGIQYYSSILIGEINPAEPSEINWIWGNSLPVLKNRSNGLAIKNNKAYMIGGYSGNHNEVWEYDILDETWASFPEYPTNSILRGHFAERRDCPDTSGIIYCFMGDTSPSDFNKPTDECYRLTLTSNDAGMFAINSPVSDTTIDAFVQVNGTVKNFGIDTFSFKIYVNIYDPDSITVFTDSAQVNNLPFLETFNIDFGSFQLTKVGSYTVEMFTYAPDDTIFSNDSLIESFNCFNYYWEPLPSSGIRAFNHATVYDPVNDLFFVTGGDSSYYRGKDMDICLSFDPKTNTWDTRQPMPTRRSYHNASYRKGFIHVLCGGSGDPFSPTRRHDVYDINSNSWDTLAPTPVARLFPGVVTWRDSLVYLIVHGVPGSKVYYYDASTNLWDTASPAPAEISAQGSKIKGDSIFIIGGSNRIILGEINPDNPAEINWTLGEPLPMGYNSYNGLAIKKNKAYMIGGYFQNRVWEYDIQNENWSQLPDYPTPFISQGNFAERRDSSDDSPVYCFMGFGDSLQDAQGYWTVGPIDKCYRLVELPLSGVNEDNKLRKNSISISSYICLAKNLKINCNITENCDLKIHIYDVLGRQVFSYLDKNIAPGTHKINVKENFNNGIYFIRIEAGPSILKQKIIFIR